MLKMQLNPSWFVFLAIIACVAGIVFAPQFKSMFMIVIVMGCVFLGLSVAMWLGNMIKPPPVPNQAVRLLLKRCAESEAPDEWTIAEFAPRVSLEIARRKVGSRTYCQEDRVNSFMMKFNMLAAARPSTVVFYSANKGVAVAKVGPVKALVEKHGVWKLDTWYCLTGALKREQMDVESLDGPQIVPLGEITI